MTEGNPKTALRGVLVGGHSLLWDRRGGGDTVRVPSLPAVPVSLWPCRGCPCVPLAPGTLCELPGIFTGLRRGIFKHVF